MDDATETTTHPAVPAWFDISTPDSDRARSFYGELFGWTISPLDDNYALVGTEGAPPSGGIGKAGDDAPYTGVVPYFPVTDVEEALLRAEKLGATRVLEPVSTPMGRIAVFADPDGNKVGLSSR